MLMRPLSCIHCGHTVFKKTSTISCSAVPPFFKCAKCNKFQPGRINSELSPITGWSMNIDGASHLGYSHTTEDFFVRHLQCRICGKKVLEFDPDDLPDGWRIEMEEMIDSLGNPMWRRYAYCKEH